MNYLRCWIGSILQYFPIRKDVVQWCLRFSCRLGPEAYQSMTKLYNDVFVNYAKLGVHLPDDENVSVSNSVQFSCRLCDPICVFELDTTT